MAKKRESKKSEPKETTETTWASLYNMTYSPGKWDEFSSRFYETEKLPPAKLAEIFESQLERYPDLAGWVLLQGIDSSFLGQHVILPYGPSNTLKAVPGPKDIVYPYGLASDSTSVVGVICVQDFLKAKEVKK